MKSDSKSFYAYKDFLMAEELNMHFSSVFTLEDTGSLPVPGIRGGKVGAVNCNSRSSG